MQQLISASHISCPGLHDVSFSLAAGAMAFLITDKEEANAALGRVLLGLEAPVQGTLSVLGKDLSTLQQKELRTLRQRMGMLQGSGGLISNLKVWENLTLPLYYHRQLSHQEIESRGLALLERVGYRGKIMELPGHLTLFQKKQIGMGRAMIVDPEVVIYESAEQGLNQEERTQFFNLIRNFHGERQGRISIILSSHPESLRELPGAVSIQLTKEQRI